jgi:sulfonate transport system ATP-binding protein
VFVMSGKPATVTDVLDVGLPRPRDRRDPELARQRAQLMDALHLARTPAAAADEAAGSTFGA